MLTKGETEIVSKALNNGYLLAGVRPGTKAPKYISNNQEKHIELIESRNKNALDNLNDGSGLGVLLDGLIAIDIDFNPDIVNSNYTPEHAVHIFNILNAPIEKHKDLLNQGIVKKGEKGYTSILRGSFPDNKLSLPSMLKAGETMGTFDLLSTGSTGNLAFTVMPPTIHPKTFNPYEYITHKTIQNTPINELPRLTKEAYKDILEAHKKAENYIREITGKTLSLPAPKKPKTHTGDSVIDDFNNAHDIRSTLEQYGYQKSGKDYVSPHSTTAKDGGGGVTILRCGTKCEIHSGSDPLCDGNPKSPFDFYRQYEHGGDYKSAVKEAAQVLGCNLDMFDDISANDTPNPPELIPVKPHRFRFVSLANLETKPVDWIIKSVIENDALILLYGQPGHGKSFIAIDMACSIATGTPWHEKPVKQGAVFYIAGEGLNGIKKRFSAWGKENNKNLEDYPIHLSSSSINMMEDSEVEHLITSIESTGELPKVIFIDTVARNFIGDENSAKDMGQFIHNMDKLRQKWGCAVIPIHHSGKDQDRGARGSTALKGAIDAEYLVHKKDDNKVVLSCKKMKDAEQPESMKFEIKSIELDQLDEEGERIKAAVISSGCEGFVDELLNGHIKTFVDAVNHFERDERDGKIHLTKDNLKKYCVDIIKLYTEDSFKQISKTSATGKLISVLMDKRLINRTANGWMVIDERMKHLVDNFESIPEFSLSNTLDDLMNRF